MVKTWCILDLSHKDPKELDIKLGGIIEIYEKFTGEDPRKLPMKIFPAVHYSMGGLWVDYDQMTNIPGLFAAGECDYSQHGANRLGANSLLSAIYGGMVAGPNAVKYMNGLENTLRRYAIYNFRCAHCCKNKQKWDEIIGFRWYGKCICLHKELGEWMTDNVTVVRYNDRLKETDEKIQELLERYQ